MVFVAKTENEIKKGSVTYQGWIGGTYSVCNPNTVLVAKNGNCMRKTVFVTEMKNEIKKVSVTYQGWIGGKYSVCHPNTFYLYRCMVVKLKY